MAMAVTYNVPFWQELQKTLKLPFGSNLRIDLLSAVVLFTIGLVASMAVAVSSKSDNLNFTNLVLISLMRNVRRGNGARLVYPCISSLKSPV